MKVFQSEVSSETNFINIIITWETFSIKISCAEQTILRGDQGPGPRRMCVRVTDLTKGGDDFIRILSLNSSLLLEWGRPLFEGVTDNLQSFMGQGAVHFQFF